MNNRITYIIVNETPNDYYPCFIKLDNNFQIEITECNGKFNPPTTFNTAEAAQSIINNNSFKPEYGLLKVAIFEFKGLA